MNIPRMLLGMLLQSITAIGAMEPVDKKQQLTETETKFIQTWRSLNETEHEMEQVASSGASSPFTRRKLAERQVHLAMQMEELENRLPRKRVEEIINFLENKSCE